MLDGELEKQDWRGPSDCLWEFEVSSFVERFELILRMFEERC